MKTTPYKIKLSTEAENDLDKSFDYYFHKSPTIADTFFHSINLSFEHIRQSPYSFSIIHKDLRRYVVKNFPFVIYYRIFDPIIQVIAIFHTRRNPEIWNNRMKG